MQKQSSTKMAIPFFKSDWINNTHQTYISSIEASSVTFSETQNCRILKTGDKIMSRQIETKPDGK